MRFTNPRVQLFQPDVEHLRHEVNHYVAQHSQIITQLRAWQRVEEAAAAHMPTSRAQLVAMLQRLWVFMPRGPKPWAPPDGGGGWTLPKPRHPRDSSSFGTWACRTLTTMRGADGQPPK